ncbi:holin [Paenibacillus bovis]|uniref:Holin n=1 Tax=Paenibacillus bovis TaxID=1616788 RepID=A0A172ZEB6_9BACL|nr:holin [Paenibacillus bovis]ANF95985.1 holin [Paenibacillus bovis]
MDMFNDVLTFASTLAVIILALVQMVKTAINIPKNLVPVLGMVIGLLIGAAAYPFTELDLVARLWAGSLGGLSATGLFELAFNPKNGTTRENR